ncbi:MAG TPA: hypothetical protein VI703_06865 [Anaerolineales bacterium]|nr:hypothetical protein [Anaerolineales bacterium]
MPRTPTTVEEWLASRQWPPPPENLLELKPWIIEIVHHVTEAVWPIAQAALRNALCPSCNHPMSIHDNRAEPVETHGCLVCAERARVRLEIERERAKPQPLAEWQEYMLNGPACEHQRSASIERPLTLICSECVFHKFAETERERAEAVAAAEEAACEDTARMIQETAVLCENSSEGISKALSCLALAIHAQGKGALDRALDKARAEAQQQMRDMGFQHPDDVAKMILSTAAREKALRERLERLAEEMLGVGPCEHHGGCNVGVEGCTYDLRAFGSLVRAALEETK